MMIHSSGVKYEGLWVNGKPAQLATKLEFLEINSETGITISQNQCFDISIRMVNNEGELIEGTRMVLFEFFMLFLTGQLQ